MGLACNSVKQKSWLKVSVEQLRYLIMFTFVPWMEVLSRYGGWIYLKGSQWERHNELVF